MAEPKEEHKDEGIENLIAVAIVALLAIGVGWFVYTQATAVPAIDTARVQIPLGSSPSLGNESAPTVVMFSDFECPYCGQFERDSFPTIKKDLIDTGKLHFVFKNFPITTHQYAGRAALAAYCADEQGKFWEYHDMLYAHQEALTEADLTKYAENLTLDMSQFGSCMNSTGSDMLKDRDLGTQLGVTGTPTFFFNGRKVVGVLTPEEFQNQLAQG